MTRLYTELAEAEQAMAKLIAERALGAVKESDKRYLRSLWQFANARSNYFLELAQNERD